MNGDIVLIVLVLLPLLASICCYLAGNKPLLRDAILAAATAAEFVIAGILFYQVFGGNEYKLSIDAIANQGIYLELDGFRALYATICSLAWFMTSLFSLNYMKHGHKQARYYFFVLFTLSATMGVFLSADLYTTFLFFELMSLASYAWVAQEETEESIKASKTYLAVAVIGGLVMLMGLFLLSNLTGTLRIDALAEACKKVEDRKMLGVAGFCLLFGFGAKAGCFPLHIWLPKAHPVAPAPASALLSGILTKSGIFGVLILVGRVFAGEEKFGELILVLGTITMVVGAVLALFSIDIKHCLACSSVSQIGFILIGAGAVDILGEENSLAARGAVLHMVNHSLFKLVLFMLAGVVVLNLGVRNFNQIRGFGRGKVLFLLCYLSGALGIAGVPFLSGYASKTLLHEAIVECGMVTGATFYTVIEWVFLCSGGATLAYMLKLFICLFVEKPSKEVEEANLCLVNEKKSYLGLAGRLAIGGSAVLIPVLGFWPNLFMDRLANLAEEFAGGVEMEEEFSYYSLLNLKGSGISIAIGLLLYFGIVRFLVRKKTAEGTYVYVNRWPEWMDLETKVYVPVLMHFLPFVGTFFARICDKLVNGIVKLLSSTILRPVYVEHSVTMLEGICNLVGHMLNGGKHMLNATFCRKHPIEKEYVTLVNKAREDFSESFGLASRSLSYGLLAFSIGLIILILYLFLSLS